MPDEHLKFEGPAGHQGCGRGQVREITEIRLRLAPVAGVSALGVGPFDLAQALHCPAADLRQGEHSGDDAWRVVFDLSEQAECLVNGGSPGKWPADGGATHRLNEQPVLARLGSDESADFSCSDFSGRQRCQF